MQDMNADECFKDGLLTNLYSTVDFLKTELIEKNNIINKLLLSSQDYLYYKKVDEVNLSLKLIETSLTNFTNVSAKSKVVNIHKNNENIDMYYGKDSSVKCNIKINEDKNNI